MGNRRCLRRLRGVEMRDDVAADEAKVRLFDQAEMIAVDIYDIEMATDLLAPRLFAIAGVEFGDRQPKHVAFVDEFACRLEENDVGGAVNGGL